MDSTHADLLWDANLIFLYSTTCFHQQVLSLGDFRTFLSQQLQRVTLVMCGGCTTLFIFLLFTMFCSVLGCSLLFSWGQFSPPLCVFMSDYFLMLFLCLHFMYVSYSSPCQVIHVGILPCLPWSNQHNLGLRRNLGQSPAGGGGCGIRVYCLPYWDFLLVPFSPNQTKRSWYHRSAVIYSSYDSHLDYTWYTTLSILQNAV